MLIRYLIFPCIFPIIDISVSTKYISHERLPPVAKVPAHCGTRMFRSASSDFSDFVVAPAVILGIGVSVYVMHLPWIAVYNFRAAICAATRSSSACECISGAIFSTLLERGDGGEREGGRGHLPSVSSVAIVRNSAARLTTEKLHLECDSTRGRWKGGRGAPRSSIIRTAVTYWNSRRSFRETYAAISYWITL